MHVTLDYCTAVCTIAMTSVPYIAKTWLQKKEFTFAVIFMFVINVHESLNAENTDAIEDDDDWKTGPRFLKKE